MANIFKIQQKSSWLRSSLLCTCILLNCAAHCGKSLLVNPSRHRHVNVIGKFRQGNYTSFGYKKISNHIRTLAPHDRDPELFSDCGSGGVAASTASALLLPSRVCQCPTFVFYSSLFAVRWKNLVVNLLICLIIVRNVEFFQGWIQFQMPEPSWVVNILLKRLVIDS